MGHFLRLCYLRLVINLLILLYGCKYTYLFEENESAKRKLMNFLWNRGKVHYGYIKCCFSLHSLPHFFL